MRKVFYTAAGILFVILIIMVYPRFNPHPPPYRMHMKSALKAFHTGCVIFWEVNNTDLPCNQETAFKQLFKDGSFPPAWGEELTIKGGGTPETFSATAFHKKSAQMFNINAQGEIEEVSVPKP